MALTSTLIADGKRVALIDADENAPLSDWRDAARAAETWSDLAHVYEADDFRAFENAYEDASGKNFDYAIIDTRGGGSELNNACLINTHAVIIPSALTTLDMTAALSTFEHAIELLQSMDMEIPVALLFQRVPVGKLTVSQKQDLATLSELPSCRTILYNRDAFAALGKRGLLHLTQSQLASDPLKRISANHLSTAMNEARELTSEILGLIGNA